MAVDGVVFFTYNRGNHSRCTWTAPTEIEFRCRTMIGVSAYLKIDNKKKINATFVGARSNFCKQKSPYFLSGTFVMLWDFFFGLTRFGWAENVWFRKT
jgi:hypothetical protein